MGINQGLYTSTTDLWETPQDFFDGWTQNFALSLTYAPCRKTPSVTSTIVPMTTAGTAMGGCLLVQPAIRAADWGMGSQGGTKRGGRGYRGNVIARPDGYALVPRLHIRQGRDPVFAGAAKVWGIKKQCAHSRVWLLYFAEERAHE